jgi:hypothetical protein
MIFQGKGPLVRREGPKLLRKLRWVPLVTILTLGSMRTPSPVVAFVPRQQQRLHVSSSSTRTIMPPPRTTTKSGFHLWSILDEQQAAGEDHDARKLGYDAERYRNRATILEHALQHKLRQSASSKTDGSSQQLSDQKLSVLQDAVHRLVQKHEKRENQIALELAKAKEVAESLEAARQRDITDWDAKHEQSQVELDGALKAVNKLRIDQQQGKQGAQRELDVLQNSLLELQSAYERDQAIWEETRLKLEQATKNLSKARKQSELRIEQLEREMQVLRSDNLALQDKLQHEHERSRRWKTKLKETTDELQVLHLQHDALLKQQEQQVVNNNAESSVGKEKAQLDIAKEQQYEEAIQIAQAAVAAAERREQGMRHQYEALVQKHESVLHDKKRLDSQLKREKLSFDQYVAREGEVHEKQRREELARRMEESAAQVPASRKPDTLGPILEHASKVVEETMRESVADEATERSLQKDRNPESPVTQTSSRRSRIVQKLVATLRPGAIGATLQRQHFTFEPPQSKWGVLKNILPRIPFRIVNIRNRKSLGKDKQ